ncbi:MAG: malonyl-ACP O-methyltransferase BioC [Gammaproteobacteria bacterium]
MDEFSLDRHALRAAFERAAASYDAAAVLQREVGTRLLERLELTTIAPKAVLDLGCGTGEHLPALRRHYPRARLYAADLALNMLAHARRRFRWWRRVPLACVDVLRLPFAAGSFDFVYCNMVLQWCDDLDQAFTELRRIVAPHGLLLFSTLGPDTLKELRAAWRTVDNFTHVNRFIDMHDIGDALIRTGFVEPVMDVEQLTLTYEKLEGLTGDLKSTGARNLTAGRPRALAGRSRRARLAAAYEEFRSDGRLPAAFEVVYGTAWTPAYLPSEILTPAERAAVLDPRGFGR